MTDVEYHKEKRLLLEEETPAPQTSIDGGTFFCNMSFFELLLFVPAKKQKTNKKKHCDIPQGDKQSAGSGWHKNRKKKNAHSNVKPKLFCSLGSLLDIFYLIISKRWPRLAEMEQIP